MKITIQDVPSVYSNRTQRLSKTTIDPTTAPYAILVLRISLGLLFLAHGCLKVFTFTLPGTAQFFESVGLPGWMAAPVAIFELVGGLLLIYLWQICVQSDPNYTGRVTVPVLWDKQSGKIVSNESRYIIQMFDREFTEYTNDTNFYPVDLQAEIDRVIDAIYQPINNGVYRSGFAVSQAAYTEAVTELFAALEYWEEVLRKQPYLCGDRITIADWCFFTTLFRFDLAYYGLFKCNLKRLIDLPNLWNYCRTLYRYHGVRSVCSVEHVKQLYYAGLPELNPSRIVPIGPTLHLDLSIDN